MKIAILTIFPEMFESVLSSSILGRAISEGLISITPVDIRPYSDRKHKNTDDYPFGGGAGMVMMAQPIASANILFSTSILPVGCFLMYILNTSVKQMKLASPCGMWNAPPCA